MQGQVGKDDYKEMNMVAGNIVSIGRDTRRRGVQCNHSEHVAPAEAGRQEGQDGLSNASSQRRREQVRADVDLPVYSCEIVTFGDK